MNVAELTAALEAEAANRRRAVRRHATPERLARAARIVIEQMESGVGAGPDDSTVDELLAMAIAEEGVSGIGTAVALWILEAVFSWAIRRAIQIWRNRHQTVTVATTG